MPSLPIMMIIGILALVLGGLLMMSHGLGEFENAFVYAAGFTVLLLIGTAVYLSYAVPSLAQQSSVSSAQSFFVEDESNLLQE